MLCAAELSRERDPPANTLGGPLRDTNSHLLVENNDKDPALDACPSGSLGRERERERERAMLFDYRVGSWAPSSLQSV
jgi:hypothetical protein